MTKGRGPGDAPKVRIRCHSMELTGLAAEFIHIMKFLNSINLPTSERTAGRR